MGTRQGLNQGLGRELRLSIGKLWDCLIYRLFEICYVLLSLSQYPHFLIVLVFLYVAVNWWMCVGNGFYPPWYGDNSVASSPRAVTLKEEKEVASLEAKAAQGVGKCTQSRIGYTRGVRRHCNKLRFRFRCAGRGSIRCWWLVVFTTYRTKETTQNIKKVRKWGWLARSTE